jgi:hypothetical protein
MTGPFTRRRFVAGTIAVGTALGGIALNSNQVSASAEITGGSFDIPDTSYTLTNDAVDDVTLAVDVDYTWDSNVALDKVEFALSAGFTADSAGVIATTEQTDIPQTVTDGTQTLETSLLDSADLDAGLFTPAGDETTVDFTAILELLLFRNGSVLASDSLRETVQVTVTDQEIQVTGSVSATGSVTLES